MVEGEAESKKLLEVRPRSQSFLELRHETQVDLFLKHYESIKLHYAESSRNNLERLQEHWIGLET